MWPSLSKAITFHPLTQSGPVWSLWKGLGKDKTLTGRFSRFGRFFVGTPGKNLEEVPEVHFRPVGPGAPAQEDGGSLL